MDKHEVAEHLLKWFQDNRIEIPVAAEALLLCTAAVIEIMDGDNAEAAALHYGALCELLNVGLPTEH